MGYSVKALPQIRAFGHYHSFIIMEALRARSYCEIDVVVAGCRCLLATVNSRQYADFCATADTRQYVESSSV